MSSPPPSLKVTTLLPSLLPQVSCDILYSFTADLSASWFGLTDHAWNFYSNLGRQPHFYQASFLFFSDGDVYDVHATISFNPKTNMLFDLRFPSVA
jgi:hypothetical protein